MLLYSEPARGRCIALYRRSVRIQDIANPRLARSVPHVLHPLDRRARFAFERRERLSGRSVGRMYRISCFAPGMFVVFCRNTLSAVVREAA